MLILNRTIADSEDVPLRRNELVLVHPIAGRIVIRLFPGRSCGSCEVGIEAPADVVILRGEVAPKIEARLRSRRVRAGAAQ